MTSNKQHTTIFINSLLSNKEIRIDQNDEKNKTLQIHECSAFKNSKTIIPIDLINAKPIIAKRLDTQWLLFGFASLVAATIFLTMSLSQEIFFPLFLTAAFSLSALFSVYAANKFSNTSYTYTCKETNAHLFTLTANDLNSSQISEFVSLLNNMIKPVKTISQAMPALSELSRKTSDLQIYYQHLEFLYEEGILDDVLLEKLEQRAYNKVNGIIDPRPLAKVIPLPVSH